VTSAFPSAGRDGAGTSALEIAFVRRGQGDPVVLVHGFTGDAGAWDEDLVAALVGRGRSVVMVDLPGHGRSPAPPAEADLSDLADGLVGVLARIGEERADWLGYSLGGRAVLALAVRHPGRVRHLVLEGASPGLADEHERSRRRRDDEALADEIVRGGIANFVDRWLAQPLFASQQHLPAEVRDRERRRRLASSPEGLARALRSFGTGRQESLWDRLGEVGAPTLLVAGELDAKFRAIGEAMASRMPRARLAIAPGAGHAVHLEHPRWFREAAEAHLCNPRTKERAA